MNAASLSSSRVCVSVHDITKGKNAKRTFFDDRAGFSVIASVCDDLFLEFYYV